MTYLRSRVASLHPSTPLVCTDADADNNNRQTGGRGHEVYLYAADNERLICTPCNSGDCGVSAPAVITATTMIASGRTATYTWTTSAPMVSTNIQSGSCTGYRGVLMPKFILPARADVPIYTGGGAAFGYRQQTLFVSSRPRPRRHRHLRRRHRRRRRRRRHRRHCRRHRRRRHLRAHAHRCGLPPATRLQPARLATCYSGTCYTGTLGQPLHRQTGMAGA